MKQRILLSLVMGMLITSLNAQKKQKAEQKPTGYAITAAEKGGRNWKEVRLVDMTTGEELKSIYKSSQEVEPLNARTGKPVEKKEITPYKMDNAKMMELKEKMKMDDTKMMELKEKVRKEVDAKVAEKIKEKKVVNLDQEVFEKKDDHVHVHVYTKVDNNNHVYTVTTDNNRQFMFVNGNERIQGDKPFATNSAAMAYDKKHERLYYTPMGINQLRYIDLKSGKIYFFENEPFGRVSGMGDGPNQITRMVIASDGNGYALTNDGRNLIRFTTGKDPVITELGELSDEMADAKVSVHSRNGYGGDMIADANGGLYLIQANRNVFKINIETKMAKWLGAIKGLPQGFSTNGAMVEAGSKVIIASSESTVGYFRFDLLTLESEKVSGSPDVFNASDLANGVLAFDKEKKKKDRKNDEIKDEIKPVEEVVADKNKRVNPTELNEVNGIIVYPNPINANGIVKVSFDSQPVGRYQLQLLDLAGKLIISQEVNVQNKLQIEELKLPQMLSGGTYLVKVFSETNKVSSISKLVVQ